MENKQPTSSFSLTNTQPTTSYLTRSIQNVFEQYERQLSTFSLVQKVSLKPMFEHNPEEIAYIKFYDKDYHSQEVHETENALNDQITLICNNLIQLHKSIQVLRAKVVMLRNNMPEVTRQIECKINFLEAQRQAIRSAYLTLTTPQLFYPV